jgi:NAD-dependent DNA ligase
MKFNSQKQFYDFLVEASNAYYNTNSPIISDNEFDNLVKQYENEFGDFYYLGTAGKEKLPVYMSSLNKIKDDNAIENYKNKIENKIIITDKIDGLSMLVKINKKGNISLYTRGNGSEGTNISDIKDYINFGNVVFPTLKDNQIITDEILIRGEIVMPNSVFNKYKNEFANARNMVAGIINSKNKDKELLKDLTFIAYSIMTNIPEVKTYEKSLRILKRFGFNTPNYFVFEKQEVNRDILIDLLAKQKSSVDYEIDGLVLSDNILHQEKEGENPKFSVAFKVNTEFCEAVVEYIQWNISKNNVIKPRIKIQPVKLNGVTINYVTGFNAKYIDDNQIGKGTVLNITRSGDVIPHIEKVVKSTTAEMPDIDYIWNDTFVDIIAINKNGKEQWIKKISYMFSLLDIKGVKEYILEKLYDASIDDDNKLLSLKTVPTLNGFKDKSSSNVLNAINELKENMTFDLLMSGSCIFTNFGTRKVQKINKEIPIVREYIEGKIKLDKEYLISELNKNGFHKTAVLFVNNLDTYKTWYNSVKNYFKFTKKKIVMEEEDEEDEKSDDEKKTIQGLGPEKQKKKIIIEDNEDDIKEIQKEIKGNKVPVLHHKVMESEAMRIKLNDEPQTIVFTGFRDAKLKKEAETKNFKVVNSISKKTSILVVSDLNSKSTKTQKAEEYNIKIIDVNNFRKMLQ